MAEEEYMDAAIFMARSNGGSQAEGSFEAQHDSTASLMKDGAGGRNVAEAAAPASGGAMDVDPAGADVEMAPPASAGSLKCYQRMTAVVMDKNELSPAQRASFERGSELLGDTPRETVISFVQDDRRLGWVKREGLVDHIFYQVSYLILI
jgi:hypothetical protein